MTQIIQIQVFRLVIIVAQQRESVLVVYLVAFKLEFRAGKFNAFINKIFNLEEIKLSNPCNKTSRNSKHLQYKIIFKDEVSTKKSTLMQFNNIKMHLKTSEKIPRKHFCIKSFLRRNQQEQGCKLINRINSISQKLSAKELYNSKKRWSNSKHSVAQLA